jgi:DNA helicase IV
MSTNPEIESEQRYIDAAYERLEHSRSVARALADQRVIGPGGTFQARYESDVIVEQAAQRLAALELGDQSLCFGRIDFEEDDERFYIGRIAVSSETSDVLVVDWRAPIAEPFYRATGREPMGLRRRRHFASQGPTLRGIDDELFGDAAAGLEHGTVQGQGALIAALEEARSGKLGDIVATIQSEQDEIIRAPLQGVLIVQGGPGTGKTVVALHRAAYLLYTHRFPLEGQGVLVIGPNRLFLSYIEQVLPSLGEAGVEISVLADLVPNIRATDVDAPAVATLKGDLRMCKLLARAVKDRQRRLPATATIPWGVQVIRVTVEESEQIIHSARRRSRAHNAGRRIVEQELFQLLGSKFTEPTEADVARDRLRSLPEVREILERMWPVLTPAQLLNDLMGSMALLRSAGSRWCSSEELRLLHRARAENPAKTIWSSNDVPLLDEALELLGPRPGHAKDDSIRTYGHIVVDEAQDLSAMELRVIDRRSLSGSMTIVGDIAQATAAGGHSTWEEILAHLPDKREPRRAELLVGYRVPAPSMRLAARVLSLAAPGLAPPRSIREAGAEPILERTSPQEFNADLARAVRRELDEVGSGSLAIICASSWIDRVEQSLAANGLDFGQAHRGRFDHQLTVAPVRLVKGLELDSCIVLDPETILEEEYRGAQSLYVALTRATKRLSILHHRELPEVLRSEVSSSISQNSS